MQPRLHKDKRKGNIDGIDPKEQKLISNLDKESREAKMLAEKRQRIKDENEQKKQQEEQMMHPSFRHRLRLYEAELIQQYMKALEKGIIPINYYQIDALLKRFIYFQKYSETVRKKLLDFGKLKIYEKDEIIFR